MKSSLVALCALCVVCVSPTHANSYTIDTGVSDSCHELLTITAYRNTSFPFDALPFELPIPKGERWRQIADGIDGVGPSGFEFENDTQKFLIVSLALGVRSPDTGGQSIANLKTLRDAHTNPNGQYQHFLRTNTDDGTQGDINAIEGSRQYIRDTIQTALAHLRFPTNRQVELTTVYFDFYGEVDVEVWMPMFLLGAAIHTLQDSFAHTVRSDDLRQIRHVMNFIEAVTTEHKESRDGLAHSDAMDDCQGDGREIAAVAQSTTQELYLAVAQAIEQDSMDPVDVFLDRWFQYEPGCTPSNNFCDSKWASLVRKDPTTPFFACTISSLPIAPRPWIPGVAFALAWCAVLQRRRRVRQSCMGGL